jgi:tRNA(Ile2) C34 agmatinyltransferase TiaS
MDPAAGIGKLGFKRWYERQLLESHAWLVSCVLCLIAVAACLEELTFRGPLPRLLALGAAVFVAGAVAIYGWSRYRLLMTEVERFAERSTCPSCRAYAAFRVVGAEGSTLRVRCRKCAEQWRLG